MKTYKLIALATVALTSTLTLADGFECRTDDGLVAKIYNHTDAELGTRTAAALILSDQKVGAGNKTIARFNDIDGTLESRGTFYTAIVDLRRSDSNRAGELIGGTKLGYVKKILIDLDFSYANPVPYGSYVPGKITLVKRDGDQIEILADCARYLKN